METFTGSITKVTARGDDGWAVAKFTTISSDAAPSRVLTIVGTIIKDFERGMITVYGEFVDTEKYGKQLKIEAAEMAEPKTLDQTVSSLVTDKAIVGVGKKLAKKLAEHFKEGLKDVLDRYPERLSEVKGITPERAEKIGKVWKEHTKDRSMNSFLVTIGIMGSGLAGRVRKKLGDGAEKIIRENPYRLIDVRGIAFKSADAIARLLGVDEASPFRARAILTYLLEQAANNGHTYMKEGELILRACEECNVGKELVQEQLEASLTDTVNQGKPALHRQMVTTVVGNYPIVYLRRYYTAEFDLAKDLARLAACPPRHAYGASQLNVSMSRAEKSLGITLNERQRDAVRMTLTRSLSILTGWPGSGKTTVLKVLVRVARDLGMRFALAAPTGRAAMRMHEVTGEPALTMHLLLQAQPDSQSFQKNRDDQLNNDLLIFDEFSMVDVELGAAAMEAVQSGCSVLFVGDPNQLPSVGPGRVLDDLITCNQIQKVTLTEIFRQAAQSLIINNAHAILQGINPRFFADPKGKDGPLSYDCYQVEPPTLPGVRQVDGEWVKKMVTMLSKERVPKKLGLNSIRDVQVLIPQKKGVCGVYEMNRYMQKALNPRPDAQIVTIGTREYRIGDRVMVTKNNRELNVSNGDIGFIKNFDTEEKRFLIEFDNREVVFPFDEYETLVLSYASTIHKSQGSEYKVVIVVLLNEHYMMLKRNLLYTAATRAKQLLIFVSQHSAIARSVKHNEVENRLSLLSLRLKDKIKPVKAKEAA